MGRLPIYGELTEEDDVRSEHGEDPMRPRDSHEEGCPGAWVRCEFVLSLSKYERIIRDTDVISSPLLDRTDDPLVLEATQFIETERVRRQAHWQQIKSASQNG
jgi:hypothetical protein